jgi:outer membrane protein TolC
MSESHEPRKEFVQSLEWQLGREIRRRNRSPQGLRWTRRLRAKTRAVVAALMLASMGLGAVGVAAAYQAQGNQHRDVLASSYQQRTDLARRRVALAQEELSSIEKSVSMGLISDENLLAARLKLSESEEQLQLLQLQLEEVRTTGREPLNEISAPVVSGRDFVIERLRAELAGPLAMLQLQQARLKAAEKRVALGILDSSEVEAARARLAEAQAQVDLLGAKIQSREQFIRRKLDASQAELQVIESEAVQRKAALVSKVQLARRELERAAQRVQAGITPRIEEAEVKLKLQELEMELAKADLDLLAVRRSLEQRRGKE